MITSLKELIGKDYLCPFCKIALIVKPNNKWFHDKCPRCFDIVMSVETEDKLSIRFTMSNHNNLCATVFQNGETWITELPMYNRQVLFLSYNSFDIDYIEQKINNIMAFQ